MITGARLVWIAGHRFESEANWCGILDHKTGILYQYEIIPYGDSVTEASEMLGVKELADADYSGELLER